jgi:hypothetical protein
MPSIIVSPGPESTRATTAEGPRFVEPAKTVSEGDFVTGFDSPVREDSSKFDVEEDGSRTASRGTAEPEEMRIMSPRSRKSTATTELVADVPSCRLSIE